MTGGRILHCIPSMGGGGAERQLAYLAGELRRLGWDVHVALASEGPNSDRLRASGATIHRLSARSNYDPRLLPRVARTVARVQPDLIQAWILQMEILGGSVAAFRRIPWILSERSSELAYPPCAKTRLRQVLASTASAVVSNSAEGDRYWARRLAARIPRYVIPNALPLDEVTRAPSIDASGLGLRSPDRVVLFVGRFSPEKNVETLVRALHSVVATPGVSAVLAGEGPRWDSVRRLCDALGLAARAKMPGFVENIPGLMKRAEVFVSPALFEGHPNAMLEAMACGCPIVASDIPAHRAFLDERSAILVPPDDPVRLAAAILEVLSNPAAAKERAERAGTVVRQWSVERVARDYDRVYCEVLRRSRSSTRGVA